MSDSGMWSAWGFLRPPRRGVPNPEPRTLSTEGVWGRSPQIAGDAGNCAAYLLKRLAAVAHLGGHR